MIARPHDTLDTDEQQDPPKATDVNAVPHEYRRFPISVDDYRRMGEIGILEPDLRVELIDGEIILMPPIGASHTSIVDRLTRLFVTGTGERAIVRVQGPVRLSELSEPQPDLALLAPSEDFYAARTAGPQDVLLLVEVADSTLRYDREVKTPLYARAGIAEYWIVDVGGGRLLRFADPSDGRWRTEDEPNDLRALRPRRLADVSFDLSWLGDRSPFEQK